MIVLIPASGVVPAELQSDFGSALSALIPVGGLPSLVRLLDNVPKGASLVVTVEESDEQVARILRAWKGPVELVPAQASLSLATVVGLALDRAAKLGDEDVQLILSDTICDLPLPPDTIGVARHVQPYRYTTVLRQRQGLVFEPINALKISNQVCVGAIRLSSASSFQRLLQNGDVEFYEALRLYNLEHRLSLHEVEAWADLGHLPSYYAYRRTSYLSRHFNELSLTPNGTVRKSSNARAKIRAEAAWYQALPTNLTVFTPRYLGYRETQNTAEYELEHVALPTVSEQLVWGRLSPDFWSQFFDALDHLLRSFWSVDSEGVRGRVQEASLRYVYLDKSRERVEHFLSSHAGERYRSTFVTNGRVWPALREVLEQLFQRAESVGLLSGGRWSVIHGDLFPGNMFFDRRADRLLCIDPRGAFGSPGLYGDPLYDLAKLSHSFRGLYDYVIAGLFDVRLTDVDLFAHVAEPPHHAAVRTMFNERMGQWTEAIGAPPAAVAVAEALLFLSMLPLHSDAPERQHVLVARALSAYDDAVGRA
jgi:hypothetical protein